MPDMIKPVHLLAGGRGRVRKMPDPLIQAALAETRKPHPSIAYVGVASGDDGAFFGYISNMFSECGAGKVTHALIAPDNTDLQKTRRIMDAADIVYVSGGDVERGMQVLGEKGMTDFIVGLFRQGKPFLGLSAGSIMLAREWVRWRDPDDDSTAELFPCLGCASVLCDTHDEEGGWEELRAALKLKEDGAVGYGIASGTAIRVYPDGKVEAAGGAVHRYLKRGAEVKRIADLSPVGT
jgi:peptidase E